MFGFRSAIREEERRDTWLAFSTLFGAMTGHALMETARDALFLSRLAPAKLPWVYLAIAATALVIAALQQRSLRGRGGRHGLVFMLLISGGMSLIFWRLVQMPAQWVLYALYTWTGVVATLIVVQFWTVIGDLFTVTQAKRIFAIIGTGGVLGAICGSALAQVITTIGPPHHLLLGAGVVFLLALIPPLRICMAEAEEATPQTTAAVRADTPLSDPARLVRGDPYLTRLALLVLVSSVALTLIDYLFKSTVAENVPAARLGSVFATTYLVVNVLSLGAQLFLVGRVTQTFGVSRVLAMLPLLLVVAVGGIAVGGALAAAFVLKGIDGAFRYSLHRTGVEVLYVPLSTPLRTKVKSFVDVAGQRGGQAIASLLILAVVSSLPSLLILSLLTIGLLVVWILVAHEIKPHYLDLFRTTLQKGAIRSRMDFPELDLASLESLIGALNSPNDAEVLAALDFFEEKNRVHLVPALILYHPSTAIVRRALDLFVASKRSDYLPIAERLVGHLDAQVRAGILRARAAHDPNEDILRDALVDPSPIVQATGIAGLLASGRLSEVEVNVLVDSLFEDALPEGKVALAKTIELRPLPVFRDVLARLAEDPDEAVLLATARALRVYPEERFIAPLMRMLDRRGLRAAVRETLASYGSPIFPVVEDALSDESVPRRVRLHIPRTLARLDPARAAGVLLDRLLEERDGAIRFKILRVMGSIKSNHPEVSLDVRQLGRGIEETLRTVFRLLDWRLQMIGCATENPTRKTHVHDLIVTMLQHKERHAVQRLFRLLQLRHPEEDLKRIHRGLQSRDAKVRASSRELLENILVSPLRESLVRLVDDVSDVERLAASEPFYRPESRRYEAVLQVLLEEGARRSGRSSSITWASFAWPSSGRTSRPWGRNRPRSSRVR